MAFIEELPSDCSDIGDVSEQASNSYTSHSNTDVEEVEEVVSDVGHTTNTELVKASPTSIVPHSVTAQDGSRAQFSAQDNEAYESISEAPVRRVDRDRRPSSLPAINSNTSSMIAEPSGTLSVDTSHYRAALLIVTFREPRAFGDPIPEPPPLPAYLAHTHAGPSQVHQEPEQSSDPQDSRPKKRRRKGPRLNHVKNERAKRARAAACREENNSRSEAAAGLLAIARGGTSDAPISLAQPTHRPMRAPVQAPRQAETIRTMKRETRKGKGKGKAKKLPESGAAATGSKRRREEEDDDVGDTQPVPSEPGPSCPTRRTRRRLDQGGQRDPALPTPMPPDAANVRQLRSRLIPLPENPVPRRGQKRRRSLAPEPSEQLVDEVRKRPRITTPAPEHDPAATSA